MRIQHQAIIFALLWTTTAAWSQQVGQTQIGQASQSTPAQDSQTQAALDLNASELLQAQVFGITAAEVRRAKQLSEGIRSTFTDQQLSPLEVLGIHARNPQERRKYAEQFAKVLREDVERTLAFDRELQAAMQRLYPDSLVVDYSGMEPVQASTGAADVAGVPRSLVQSEPHPRASHASGNASRRAIEQLQRK